MDKFKDYLQRMRDELDTETADPEWFFDIQRTLRQPLKSAKNRFGIRQLVAIAACVGVFVTVMLLDNSKRSNLASRQKVGTKRNALKGIVEPGQLIAKSKRFNYTRKKQISYSNRRNPESNALSVIKGRGIQAPAPPHPRARGFEIDAKITAALNSDSSGLDTETIRTFKTLYADLKKGDKAISETIKNSQGQVFGPGHTIVIQQKLFLLKEIENQIRKTNIYTTRDSLFVTNKTSKKLS